MLCRAGACRDARAVQLCGEATGSGSQRSRACHPAGEPSACCINLNSDVSDSGLMQWACCAEQAHAEMRTLGSRVAKLQAVALSAAEPESLEESIFSMLHQSQFRCFSSWSDAVGMLCRAGACRDAHAGQLCGKAAGSGSQRSRACHPAGEPSACCINLNSDASALGLKQWACCAEQAHAEMRTLDSRIAKLRAVALCAAKPATLQESMLSVPLHARSLTLDFLNCQHAVQSRRMQRCAR